MQTDFIVIGSGLAGLTSSLILSECGKVLLITKGKLSDGSTNWAQGGIACAVSGNDSWQKHMRDTLIAGIYHNDKQAVEFLVRNAPAAIDWLSKQGVPFEKVQGKFKTGREGGHSYNRIIHATDFTGKEIELALTKRVKENRNIEVWENAFAKSLLVENGKCFGVEVVKSSHSGERSDSRIVMGSLVSQDNFKLNHYINIFSQTVILATGGLGQLYAWTTNPSVSSGDGYALAYQAGAVMKDMEFIQFHPTALKQGESPLFLLSEALRGEGGILVRTKDQRLKTKDVPTSDRFMDKYDKRAELAPRDIVARAIYHEQQNGYGIYLDIRHKGKDFLKIRFPNIYNALKKRGFDLGEDLIPVTPAAHFSCGGVKTDLYGRTNIKNMFAFGEVACTGVHGANRLASNSLLEAVVFPLRLSRLTAEISRRIEMNGFCHPEGVKRLKDPTGFFKNKWDSSHTLRMTEMWKNIQQLMWEKVGIVRRKKDLKEAKEQLEFWEKELADSASPNQGLLELKNMILVARLITEAALKRKKSLGAHFINSDA